MLHVRGTSGMEAFQIRTGSTWSVQYTRAVVIFVGFISHHKCVRIVDERCHEICSVNNYWTSGLSIVNGPAHLIVQFLQTP